MLQCSFKRLTYSCLVEWLDRYHVASNIQCLFEAHLREMDLRSTKRDAKQIDATSITIASSIVTFILYHAIISNAAILFANCCHFYVCITLVSFCGKLSEKLSHYFAAHGT